MAAVTKDIDHEEKQPPWFENFIGPIWIALILLVAIINFFLDSRTLALFWFLIVFGYFTFIWLYPKYIRARLLQ